MWHDLVNWIVVTPLDDPFWYLRLCTVTMDSWSKFPRCNGLCEEQEEIQASDLKISLLSCVSMGTTKGSNKFAAKLSKLICLFQSF